MSEQPDMVLITVDSFRADHCSFTGNRPETTPALDSLAADGTVFKHAIAPGPSTPESMPATFTGYDPVTETTTANLGSFRADIRRHMSVRETLPERLSRVGYATAAFTPNPFTSRYFGFDQGFDRFEDFMDSMVRRGYRRLFQRLFHTNSVAVIARAALNLWQREEVFKPWEAYYDEAVAWAHATDRPYFLWLHVMDTHIPYIVPREYRSQSWRAMVSANLQFWRGDKESSFGQQTHDRLRVAYDDAIRYVDELLNRLVNDLRGDPLIIVHGDHGEAFGEHGVYGHEPYLYEENIHVPLVVGNAQTRTVEEPLTLRALPELLGTAAMTGELSIGAHSSFVTSRSRQGARDAVRGRRMKFIQNRNGTELYDLSRGEDDTIEDDELWDLCHSRVERLRATDREVTTIEDAVREVA